MDAGGESDCRGRKTWSQTTSPSDSSRGGESQQQKDRIRGRKRQRQEQEQNDGSNSDVYSNFIDGESGDGRKVMPAVAPGRRG